MCLEWVPKIYSRSNISQYNCRHGLYRLKNISWEINHTIKLNSHSSGRRIRILETVALSGNYSWMQKVNFIGNAKQSKLK